MTDPIKMMENLNSAAMACDTDCKIIYANEKCRDMFKKSMGIEKLVGTDMKDCHKPETMDKLKILFDEYKHKSRELYYYTMETPDGTLTLVNVPFYDEDTFSGVMEFIFQSALG